MAKDIIPPYARVYLIQVIGGVKESPIEITDDVMNWQELEIRQSRDGFSGVFVDVSQEIKIVDSKPTGTWTQGNGKQILHDIFMARGLGAQVYIEIHKRENFGFNYSLVYRGMLNFGTYAEERDFVTIESESRDFNSLISSLGKTKYDISVKPNEEKNDPGLPTVDWKYQHNEVLVESVYTIGEAPQLLFKGNYGLGTFGVTAQTLSISSDKAIIPLAGTENDFKSQELATTIGSAVSNPLPQIPLPSTLPDAYFCRGASNSPDVLVSFKFSLYADFAAGPTSNQTRLILVYKTLDGTVVTVKDIDFTQAFGDFTPVEIDETVTVSLPDGAELKLLLLTVGVNSDNSHIIIDSFDHFWIRYIDKSKQTDTIPAISPVDFSNRLLSLMTGSINETPYTTQIDTDTLAVGYNHYLVAGESIRGWENDTFHASYDDFLEYMQFLGYEWEVDEDARQIIYRKRDYFFNPDITALDLTKEEVAGLMMKAEPEYAYSTVKIGYEKPDIENTNGKFAICGTNDYTTDYKGAPTENNVLEIKCPYKADPVEIEVLSWSRGEKTKDTKNDNDIFMLAAVGDGTITEYRDLQYQATVDQFTVKFYNAPYIPYFMALRNIDKAGIVASQLNFAGTDAFRGARLTGTDQNAPVDIYGGITVTNKLFLPIIYEFEAGTHHDLPDLDTRRGLIRFMWEGERKQGYIREIIKNPCAEQGVTWILLAK